MNKILLISLSFCLIGVLLIILVGFKRPTPTVKEYSLQHNIREVTSSVVEGYPLHRDIIATVFWIGEEATLDNNYISNRDSIWDPYWEENFGGVDTPDERDGWFPKGFTPSENPFYVALPYSDSNEEFGKKDLTIIPWYKASLPKSTSIVKNRWVKIYHKNKVCFAQWEDAGPYLTNDVEYVFGTAKPKNTFGKMAGIDISPAVRDCLEVGSVSKIDWQFVDDKDVPSGPWKLIITRS